MIKTDFMDEDFTDWVDNFFYLDPLILNIVFQLYLADKDKQTDAIGLIIERRAAKPITSAEILQLHQYLSKKGLPIKRKHDRM